MSETINLGTGAANNVDGPDKPVLPDPCTWQADEDGNWQCCGDNIFCTTDEGPPSIHGFKFCPYCGKPINEIQYSEPEEPND